MAQTAHGDYSVSQGIHAPFSGVYANAAALAAATGFIGREGSIVAFRSIDIGKIVLQLDTWQVYILTSITPTWTPVGADLTTCLLKSNNLSDLPNAATARTNLGISTVGHTGAYSDLSGKPSLSAVAISGAYGDLSGTPSFATVATSGSYSDLINTPSGQDILNLLNTAESTLNDLSGYTSVDWLNHRLYGVFGDSIDYQNQMLYHSDGVTGAYYWDQGYIVDPSDQLSIYANGRTLNDSNSVVAVDWLNRMLYSAANGALLDFSNTGNPIGAAYYFNGMSQLVGDGSQLTGVSASPDFGSETITSSGGLSLTGSASVSAYGGSFGGNLTAAGLFSTDSTMGLGMNPGALVRWGSAVYYLGYDVGLTRNAAGVLEVNNGTSIINGGSVCTILGIFTSDSSPGIYTQGGELLFPECFSGYAISGQAGCYRDGVGNMHAFDTSGNDNIISPHPIDAPAYDWGPGCDEIAREINLYGNWVAWKFTDRIAQGFAPLALYSPGSFAFLTDAKKARQNCHVLTGVAATDAPLLAACTYYEETLADYNTRRGLTPGTAGYLTLRDWTADQTANQTARANQIAAQLARKAAADAAVAAWNGVGTPPPAFTEIMLQAYVMQPKPAFIS